MTNARDKANIPVLNFQSKGIDDNATSTAISLMDNSQTAVLVSDLGNNSTVDIQMTYEAS